jgi:hypothetical protein
MRVPFAVVVVVLLCACGGVGKPHATVSVDAASLDAVASAGHLKPVYVTAGGAGLISFDRPPISVDLRTGPDEAHMSTVPLSGFTFRAPSTPGIWEYLLIANWNEGDVSWVFLISVEGL